jgi:hypothetical protein
MKNNQSIEDLSSIKRLEHWQEDLTSSNGSSSASLSNMHLQDLQKRSRKWRDFVKEAS